jgi:hypothetical protein
VNGAWTRPTTTEMGFLIVYSFDAQNELSQILHDLTAPGNIHHSREEVMSVASAAMMEMYQNGYYDASTGERSKVTGEHWVDLTLRRGAAMNDGGAAIYTGPRGSRDTRRYEAAVCPEEIKNWEGEGGAV